METSAEESFDLAIVGAGFSGSMVAIHALGAARGPLKIALINKSADFGRGIAYGTRSPVHLLNVPVGRMSALVDDPDDFFRWISNHPELRDIYGVDAACKDQFIPRAIFGEYVSQLLERRLREAPPGVVLQRIVGEVEDMRECRGGMQLWLADETRIFTHKVVLAPGNFPPGDPPLRDRAIFRARCYLGTPWLGQRMDQIKRAQSVLVLGMGLTAIDLILALQEAGVTGQMIHLLSRKGQMPQPHRASVPYPPFIKEKERAWTIRTLFRRIRAEVRRADAEGIDWRPVLDSLRALTPHLWQSLDLENKRRFLRHARSWWETHRHRVPQRVQDELKKLEAAGTLVRHAGRIESMRAIDNGHRAHVRFRDPKGNPLELEVDLIVNCTGPESNYRKLDDPFIINLLARGLIHPDPMLLGLEVAPNGAVVNMAGNYSSILYTLGSPRRGQLWETTAVPELRQQAQRLGRELVNDLQPIVPAREVAVFEI